MDLHRKFWPGWEGETEVRQLFAPEEFTCEAESMKFKAEAAARK